ncbi:MAG TPA: TonB-dependent receptor [Blastocatellia bacterium]|nr:TonB-dependent receptor [Blastocatellia bacterium]
MIERRIRSLCPVLIFILVFQLFTFNVLPQATGGAGTIEGTVVDPNKAVVVNATVILQNVRTGYKNTTHTDEKGAFRFNDVPPNPYSLVVMAQGFGSVKQDLDVRSSVPMNVTVPLSVESTGAIIDVTPSVSDVIENDTKAHQDIDKSQIARMPLSTPGNGLSDVVTLKAPGVVGDSNGFFHPLGDHAQSQQSIDGQPIADQQSKAFSTQLPVNIFQSLEVITGATPAEYGDKDSLVINAITRSGINQTKPTGSFSTSYGRYGTVNTQGTLAYGRQKWGNFVAFNYDSSGRFLDPPEFQPLHDHGTAASFFDRIDYNPTAQDSFHLNLVVSRNNMEIPNQFDQQAIGQDQRNLIHSLNIAPGYVHVFNSSLILTVNPYFRSDWVRYPPSANPFSDQTQTIGQQRRLVDAGIKADIAYNKGRHDAKFGVQFSHHFLTEGFQFGLTDPLFNAPCTDADGNPLPGNGPCDNVTTTFDNPAFLPGLLPFDLTRGGTLFNFHGHTDIKQEALYAQDQVKIHDVNLSLGLRFDNYNGFVHDSAVQPRVGISYLLKKTGTVFRGSYTRNFETPYNENLILSSLTGAGGLANNGVLDTSASDQPLRPGRRNQFNLGFEQAAGRYVVIDVDYFNKRTINAYDFNVLLNTPITFPIAWDHSKIDGISARVELAPFHGWSAFFVAGHNRARFFPPEVGGLFFNSALPTGPFRIDHDQEFQQTTQVQYQFEQFGKLMPYVAFTWRYESGLVAGSVPDFDTALTLTPDQQGQIGLFCGNFFASFQNGGISSCPAGQLGVLRVKIPAAGTENDDTNPPRIAPRNLFDLSVGTDNLLRTEHARVTFRLTGVNLTNKVALYNFLSTFSGTHFVTGRNLTAQIGLVF